MSSEIKAFITYKLGHRSNIGFGNPMQDRWSTGEFHSMADLDYLLYLDSSSRARGTPRPGRSYRAYVRAVNVVGT